MDYSAMFGTEFIVVPTLNFGGDPVKIQLKNANIIIYSSEGKIISQKKFFGNTVSIDRNQMASGLYFYLVISNDNLISKGKFVVQ
jgi:hypothetical protein